MIRIATERDTDGILEIWLSASVKAHGFMPPSFWESRIDAMRTLYLPSSEVHVLEDDGMIVGFYALHDDTLAAIFVAPAHQGEGMGRLLMAHAEQQREVLSLSVYKDNRRSVDFYLKLGFETVDERVDPHTGHEELVMRKARR